MNDHSIIIVGNRWKSRIERHCYCGSRRVIPSFWMACRGLGQGDKGSWSCHCSSLGSPQGILFGWVAEFSWVDERGQLGEVIGEHIGNIGVGVGIDLGFVGWVVGVSVVIGVFFGILVAIFALALGGQFEVYWTLVGDIWFGRWCSQWHFLVEHWLVVRQLFACV